MRSQSQPILASNGQPETAPSAAAIIHELQHIRVGMLDHYSASTLLEKLIAKAQKLPVVDPAARPADAAFYVGITYVTLDGQEMRNEIPADPKEVDTSYLGRLLQHAYDHGRRDQSEQDARIMDAALTDIRLRVEKRGAHQVQL